MAQFSIMFIAGDPSGDQHTGAIIRRLKHELPGAKLWGIGGPAMEREGFEPVMPFAGFNRMGYLEVALHLRFFLKARSKLIGLMKQQKPDILVCVDYSGFNIPIMKAAALLAIPVVWYIAPMVWAWKRKKAAVLGAHASHIGVIFPFEEKYFTGYRAQVSFVGNPTVEAMEREGAFSPEPRRHPGREQFRLAIVPGSRRQEVEHLLPPMIKAFNILQERYPGIQATISRYAGIPLDLYRTAIGDAQVELFEGSLRTLLGRSDFALVTSGTATLETALAGVPLVIAYKTSPVTYTIARLLVHIPDIGLPNIIAGERIVPECVQGNANAEELASQTGFFIDSPDLYDATASRLSALRRVLGEKKPSCELTRKIMSLLAGTGNQ